MQSQITSKIRLTSRHHFKISSRSVSLNSSKVHAQRQIIEEIGRSLGVKQFEDWYNVSHQDVTKRGGEKVLRHYNRSLANTLSNIFQEYDWKLWKFQKIPQSAWIDKSNHKQFFDDLGKEIGINSLDDWYKVTRDQLQGGKELIKLYYNDSLYQALKSIYPENLWQLDKFEIKSDVPVHPKLAFKKIEEQLEIKEPKDWYQVDLSDERLTQQSRKLISKFRNIFELVSEFYPTIEWFPWKFKYANLPKGYWSNMDNQVKYINWLEKELNIKHEDDWYNVKASDMMENGGSSLLSENYSCSFIKFLLHVMPNRDWKIWLFDRVPSELLTKEVQRKYLDWVGCELGVKKMEDWYQINPSEVIKRKGGTFMKMYGFSFIKFITNVYNEFPWLPWKFRKAPNRYWTSRDNQREFMNWAAIQLKLENKEAWYKVTFDDISELGGGRLLSLYGSSLVKALVSIYPEENWELWRFNRSPYGLVNETKRGDFQFWKQNFDMGSYMKYISGQLRIQDLNDWYRISVDQIRKLGGFGVIHQMGGLSQVLEKYYPNHQWSKAKILNQAKKSSQRWLFVILKELFPNLEIMEDYNHPQLKYKETNEPMQVDVYVPALNLALEYQGEQHYPFGNFYGTFDDYKRRDAQKRLACKQSGVTLIEIPFWWDRKAESIAATIRQQRPDITFQDRTIGAPIPPQPPHIPPRYVIQVPLMVAEEWDIDHDLSSMTGWWVTDIQHGVRTYWDGKSFYTLSKRGIPAPESYKNLPPMPIDGIFISRTGQYQDAQKITRKHYTKDWDQILFVAMDLPDSKDAFPRRFEALKSSVSVSDFIRVASYEECKGKDHLNEIIDMSRSRNSHSLIMKHPSNPYQSGRSDSMIEMKVEQVSNVKLIGPHESEIAVICEQDNGKQVIVKCNGQQFSNLPPLGTVIQVRHQGIWKSGKLKYPIYIRNN